MTTGWSPFLALLRLEMRRRGIALECTAAVMAALATFLVACAAEKSSTPMFAVHRPEVLHVQTCRLYLIALAITMPLLGALLAGRMASARRDDDVLKALLLTRIPVVQIAVARLTNALTAPTVALAASALSLCSFAAHSGHFAEELSVSHIVRAHAVLLFASAASGAVALWAAMRIRSASPQAAGLAAGSTFLAVSLLVVFWIDPIVVTIRAPEALIETALVVNPVAGVAAAIQVDILRERWLYGRTHAHDYAFRYPPFSAVIFELLMVTTAALLGAGRTLRREPVISG